ncbi:glycosyltransferase [Roseobacter sp. MH60115]|uniref:glycosyltransferase n=1 Tax=Roseobacter sp. MH60115 TaxID=2785324 RepID=UPI0018A27B68|nr:glycosyltransferase [Roseobacter sp. MH60115]
MSKDHPSNLEGYDYLQRILSQRMNENALKEAKNSLDVDFEIVGYEAIDRQSSGTNRQVERKGERPRVEMLEIELTRILRRPWKPLLETFKRKLAFAGAAIAKHVAPGKVGGLQRSVKKRNPDRFLSASTKFDDRGSRKYRRQSKKMIQKFGDPGLSAMPLHMHVGSGSVVQQMLAAVRVPETAGARTNASFSVVTPFHTHVAYFETCAQSVLATLEYCKQPVEWVIFNDDPNVADDDLRALIPEKLLAQTTILSDGQNHGIAGAQNLAIASARHSWIVLLDCDDALEPQALPTLNSEIIKAPRCRYFTSLMIDMDKNGKQIRQRKREHALTNMFDKGMLAGHMVAFRKDLFEELGGFDTRFAGVQDFDFALRTAIREPIKGIDQYLYRYRWHHQTQSVGKSSWQETRSYAVRAQFLRNLSEQPCPPAISTKRLPHAPTALCVIRTQGNRMELLDETIASVRSQSIAMTPCVIVHGDQDKFGFVSRRLAAADKKSGSSPVVVLHADEVEKRRGYPCNVGLDYLCENQSKYDLLCFLDDDDHYLPGFGERLANVLRDRSADFAFGISNALPVSGEPFVQHGLRPAVGLLAGNFITFNSFIVRTDAILNSGIRFDETIHYMEDYDFLLKMLQAGFRMEPLPEAVCEYRLIGDGNAEIKQDEPHFKVCQTKVKNRAKAIATRFPAKRFWAELASFPGVQRPPFEEEEIIHMQIAWELIRKSQKGAL